MKNTFSRLFGLGEKEEQMDVETNWKILATCRNIEEKVKNEEIKKIPIDQYYPESFSTKNDI